MKALIFHKMDTEEISDRYVAPCFVNGLEAYDGEINLGMEENMFHNQSRRGRGQTRGSSGKIIYVSNQELDPFLDSSGEEEKIGDDWDLLLDDLNFRDIPNIEGVGTRGGN
ncbi:hypothetical protein Tco_1306061 [Tanacetum coccineum]